MEGTQRKAMEMFLEGWDAKGESEEDLKKMEKALISHLCSIISVHLHRQEISTTKSFRIFIRISMSLMKLKSLDVPLCPSPEPHADDFLVPRRRRASAFP